MWPKYSFRGFQEVILSVSPPRNPIWNFKYILKKNIYILKYKKNVYPSQNMYFFINVRWDSNYPYYGLNIHLGELEKWFQFFPYCEIQFVISFHKNMYIFIKTIWDLNHPNYDLKNYFGDLKKWFESLPHPEIQF